MTSDFETDLSAISAFVPGSYDAVMGALDAAWIEEALVATGVATIRRRRLPQEHLVWLVIGMALMRNLPITEVVRRLDVTLPTRTGARGVAPATISQGRQRLGAEALEWLFWRSTHEWCAEPARASAWHGLAVWGLDGTVQRVADSPENRTHFGASKGTGDGAYPLVRLVVAMELRTHLMAAAHVGPNTCSEQSLARSLWPSIPSGSVVLVDRGHFDVRTLHGLDTTDRHWVTRAKSSTQWRVLKPWSRTDALIEMDVSKAARRIDPTLPRTWRARAIHYRRKGFRPATILTSLLDDKRYPAKEIVDLYHERWELELGFRELKSIVLDRQETLRSKSPAMVNQELWGLLIAYNLVRLEMVRTADHLKVPATRISFAAVLREVVVLLRDALHCTTPGALPGRIVEMRELLRHFVLPPRRPKRTYPRAVKLFNSKYPSRTTYRKSSSRKPYVTGIGDVPPSSSPAAPNSTYADDKSPAFTHCSRGVCLSRGKAARFTSVTRATLLMLILGSDDLRLSTSR